MRFSLPIVCVPGARGASVTVRLRLQRRGRKTSQAADLDQRIVVDNFRAPVADWALESDAAYILSLSGCLETLTRYDESQGKIVPSLATEWKQASPLEWDFTIREGVKFQDGSALTADAVVGSLQNVLEAEVPARAFSPKVVSGVKALDDHTVRVTTPTESPLVPYRLASVNTGVLVPGRVQGRNGRPVRPLHRPLQAGVREAQAVPDPGPQRGLLGRGGASLPAPRSASSPTAPPVPRRSRPAKRTFPCPSPSPAWPPWRRTPTSRSSKPIRRGPPRCT